MNHFKIPPGEMNYYSGIIPTPVEGMGGEEHNIINKVCSMFRKHSSYLFVRDKKHKRVYMRQLCIYLLRLNGFTEADTADIFGLKREVINYPYKKIKDLLTVDKDVQEDMERLF